MEIIENKTRVPYFESVADVMQAQYKKNNFQPTDLYPRDGYCSLSGLEGRVSQLAGVGPENLLLYNSGMSAIVDALEIRNPSSGTVILHGEQLYNQSLFYIRDCLRPRGVKTVGVDCGSFDDIAQSAAKYRPQVIFLETVANSPDLAVLDIDRLAQLSAEEQSTLIILDNTLPSPANLPLGEIIKHHANLAVVESGTKFYGLNQEMCGIAYTYNGELLAGLRKRRRFGSILSPSAAETINSVLPSKEDFDKRNRNIAANAFSLAIACSQADSDRFITIYPNLQTHPNHKDANFRFPFGAAPVLFIQITDLGDYDQFTLTKRLWENAVIRKYCRLGQSFGFDHTRIWPDSNFPAIRVAGGTESEENMEQLAQAFNRVLTLISTGEVF